jgi:hypothetical protein
MPHTLTLTLSDEEFEALAKEAAQQKKSPEQVALEHLETTLVQSPKTAGKLEELFGSWSSGNPSSADNEGIDADLMREYASTHDD